MFKGEALDWWLSLKTAQQIPSTWVEFEQAVKNEFIPAYYERSVMEKLKHCKQTGSATDYVKQLRRLVPSLPDISEREKWDKFVDGLKPNLRTEVCREPSMCFEEAAKLAVRMDLVLHAAKSSSWGGE